MYKVFDSLDGLVNLIEKAPNSLLGSDCKIDRNAALELLDILREALPIELDDAQDVLDDKDKIIADAHAEADRIVAEGQASADTSIAAARAEADAIVSDAHAEADAASQRAEQTLSSAEEESRKVRDDARVKAEEMVARATEQADRLAREGKAAYERSVNEGIEERARLVSESSVARAAEDEARRIVEKAHSDSAHLRKQCDEFVDTKLSEFEESLTATLRTVTRDRTALRRGAGVSGSVRTDHRSSSSSSGERGYSRRSPRRDYTRDTDDEN